MGKCHFALFTYFREQIFKVHCSIHDSEIVSKYSAAMTLSRGFRGRSSRKWESFFAEIRRKEFLPIRCCAFLSQVLTISFSKFGPVNLLYMRHFFSLCTITVLRRFLQFRPSSAKCSQGWIFKSIGFREKWPIFNFY